MPLPPTIPHIQCWTVDAATNQLTPGPAQPIVQFKADPFETGRSHAVWVSQLPVGEQRRRLKEALEEVAERVGRVSSVFVNH